MSHIWTFSPKSKVLLQRCIEAAGTTDNSNMWLERFGPKNLTVIKKLENTVIIPDSPDAEIKVKEENQEDEILNALEEITDEDYDLIANFNNVQEKCLNNPRILTRLAENFSTNILEKLIQHIFEGKDIKSKFLHIFFEYFLPVYIRRDNSRACTDLLSKTYNSYPQYFKMLLEVILKDLVIQNNIINDFILALSSNDQTEFLNIISNIQLTGQEFSHNLFNIYTAYKSCDKTDCIQNYIFSVLKTHSQFCSIDKNYGKLLLAYMQNVKSSKFVMNKIDIETIVETHKSPFKRPCLAILKELNYG